MYPPVSVEYTYSEKNIVLQVWVIEVISNIVKVTEVG